MVDDAAVAFPTLDAHELTVLEALGTRRSTTAGEYLYREGDAAYDFFVVLSGVVEIVARSDGVERIITSHGRGRFVGELNLLTGQRAFLSARVLEPGEVIVVPRAALQHVIATQPSLGDTILAAFMARRSQLLVDATAAVRVVGSRFSPELLRIREFLSRNRIPHQWMEPERDADAEHVLREFEVAPAELPVVIVSGWVLRQPTPGSVAEYLGLTIDSLPDRCFDLVVVGAGPAGLAAAVYGASEGLANATARDGRRRRPGGDQLADRELPRVSDRDLGRRSHRASGRAGREIRRPPHQSVHRPVPA